MLQEKKGLLSMRDSGEEAAELMDSYEEIYETFKTFCPIISQFYAGVSFLSPTSPILNAA